ncbi:MAG: hypothetical protein APR63_03560 [Desulfuromonas sp. SDB]|nr:MAG: hypothetical protein APR63_03560 [Desulfuromonas sp. SDB]
MKRKADLLLKKSIDSLILSIEHYNRFWSCSRHEAVLIFLDRGFELLLKAAIVQRGGKIRDPRAKETYNFSQVLRKCLSNSPLKCLNDDDALTIQTINSLRDAAQHHILDISEEILFVYVLAGFTLFKKLLTEVFKKDILEYIPERVVPIFTVPVDDISELIKTEFKDIKKMVSPGKRRRVQARAKLRALVIIEESLSGIRSQPSEKELGWVVRKIREGVSWTELFPRLNSLILDISGKGHKVDLTINKKKGEPVHLVPEGTPGGTIIAIKHVNELSFYSFDLKNLASKLGIETDQLKSLINQYNLQSSDEYFKEIRICSSLFKRYSVKALEFLRKKINPEQISAVT